VTSLRTEEHDAAMSEDSKATNNRFMARLR
jgi:hypothetical protein